MYVRWKQERLVGYIFCRIFLLGFLGVLVRCLLSFMEVFVSSLRLLCLGSLGFFFLCRASLAVGDDVVAAVAMSGGMSKSFKAMRLSLESSRV